MTTTIITPDQDAIVTEVDIEAPPDRVFRALTDSSELARWFGGSERCPVKSWKMDARLGGHYSYTTPKASLVINGVSEFACHGEIIEYDPPRLLAYTWFGNWHDDVSLRTLVRWELTATGNGTRVRVTHSGLTELPMARKDYSGGWPGVLEQLRQFAEKGRG